MNFWVRKTPTDDWFVIFVICEELTMKTAMLASLGQILVP
jgi:hypothetical protein